MIKKFFAVFVLLCCFVIKTNALDTNDISAECAVLITEQSGNIIFEKNAYKKHSMASTTKIMTALLAVESGFMKKSTTITDSMVNVEGTSMGLSSGDVISIEALSYGMLLSSGNDAANAVSETLFNSKDEFINKMNERAKEIGMLHTNFVTPSGLDDENHYSTAYDMALLGREAVLNPEFLKICSSKNAVITYGNPIVSLNLSNHNKLLSYYPYSLGIKTGFTKKSGRCLVSYAQKDGVGLIAVTLNDGNDWEDHKKMLDYGFSCIKSQPISVNLPEVSVVGGTKNSIKTMFKLLSYDSKLENLSYKLYFPHFVYAPILTGDIIGKIDVYIDGKYLLSADITAAESVC